MKKIISALLTLTVLLSVGVGAMAESNPARTVIGADLTDEQVRSVYEMFGIKQGDVPQLLLTNAEERQYLESFVDGSVIGTRSISCVYVELLPEGSGLDVTTHNVTWFTSEMYAAVLATVGITDARIIVAAPFEVSGTSALAGIYKAYEDMTRGTLDDTAKQVGTQELTITGKLAEEIGSADTSTIVNELKKVLTVTAEMTDEEIIATVTEIASRYNVKLTDTQKHQLLTLCRSLEKLDPDALRSRVEDVQGTLQKMSETKDKVAGFMDRVQEFFASVSSFFDSLQGFLDRFN